MVHFRMFNPVLYLLTPLPTMPSIITVSSPQSRRAASPRLSHCICLSQRRSRSRLCSRPLPTRPRQFSEDLHGQEAQNHTGAYGGCQDEDSSQRVAVCVHHSVGLSRWNDAEKIGRTRVDSSFGTEVRNSRESVHKLARKGILTDRKEHGAIKPLHKEHQRHADRDVNAW